MPAVDGITQAALFAQDFLRKKREREREALAKSFTLEALSLAPDGRVHDKALAFGLDASRWIQLMCSRRAGKTVMIAGRFAFRSKANPGGNRVYMALTATQARDIMWEPIWKPMVEKWGLRCSHNDTRMVTHFENGSKVRFTGMDDREKIKRELGAGLTEVALDECHEASQAMLSELVKKILPPALGDQRGTMIMAGVVPETESGFFWDNWSEDSWSKHNWSQMDNPFMPDPMGELMEYLAKNPGLTIDSPLIQRERFGRFVFDKDATAYTYSPEVNRYTPEEPEWLAEVYADLTLRFATRTRRPDDGGARFGLMAAKPHEGITQFSAAIDPGAVDRFSINVTGWGTETTEIQHVFEWSSPRKAGVTWGQSIPILKLIQDRYAPYRWCYDAAGSKMELDTFRRDTGIPVIAAAEKRDKKGQIRRTNDLLTRGWLRIMEGSATEEDYRRARFDPNPLKRARCDWSSQWHPDPAESLRYSLAPFMNLSTEPEESLTEEQRIMKEDERAIAELYKPKPKYGPPPDAVEAGRTEYGVAAPHDILAVGAQVPYGGG